MLFSAYGVRLHHTVHIRFICIDNTWFSSVYVIDMICILYRVSELLKFSAENGILCVKQWEAVIFPLCLTSLMYTGSFIHKFFSIWNAWTEHGNRQIDISFHGLKSALQSFINWMLSLVYNISVWRTYIVVSL